MCMPRHRRSLAEAPYVCPRPLRCTADQKLAPQRPEISWLMQLPQCGMLIVARNGKELKLSDIIVGDEAQEELAAEVVLLEEGSAGYQVLLNKYAEVRD